jgi:hypothetical protein
MPRVQQQHVSPDAAALVAPLQPSCVTHLPRMLRAAAQPPPPLIVPLPPHRPPLSLPSSSYWTPPSHERKHGRRHVCARRPPESHLRCVRPLGLRVSRPWKGSPWRRNCRVPGPPPLCSSAARTWSSTTAGCRVGEGCTCPVRVASASHTLVGALLPEPPRLQELLPLAASHACRARATGSSTS